jgi:hypothetical protein
MPRQNDGTELFRRITRVEMVRPVTPAVSTTLTASIGENATLYSLTSATGLTVAGTPLILAGDGGIECNETVSAVSNDLTVKYKTEWAHAAGGVVHKSEVVFLGEIDESGVSMTPSQDKTDIFGLYSDTPLATIPGQLTFDVSFSLLGHNIENFLLWLGQKEQVRGTGTASDPWQSGAGGRTGNRSLSGLQAIRVSGTRHDGKLWVKDYNGATITASGAKTMGRTGTSGYQITASPTQVVKRVWAP